jgi:hypothetical protein
MIACPGQAATPQALLRRAGTQKPQSTLPQHGPRLCSASRREEAARCAASGAREIAAISPMDIVSRSRGRFRPSFAVRFALIEMKGRKEGRAPAGTQGPHAGKRTRGDHRCCRDVPAFPAQWFYGLWRALPGERCTIAPVALRMTDARARSGRFTTASLDAQTPGVRTTRFCRPRTSPPKPFGSSRVLAPDAGRHAVTAPCRSRGSR